MKPNRTVIIAFLAVLLPAAVFAGGGKDEPEYEAADGMENWDHTFDVSGYEEGTYNLLIRGVDRAGNVTYGGPYNVKIDPASDLPVTRISNPSPGMRVGTNLNIVGTAVDDDGIGRVEVRIDDGPWVRADGTEFWSTYLDTARLAEGPHVVTARGIDINGKEGLETSVTFHFDRAKPRITITSHRSGMLLSGKAELSGTVEDDNGVASISFSRDGGETYRPLKLNLDKETGIYAFSVKVDTADLEDGPTVYWFRGVDGTGSVGNSAFLFFVDNEGPELTILSPSSDEIVNGVVTVTGMVTDAVGVKSLAYVENGTPVEIPLVPGNPYWTIPIDFTTYKTKSADAEFVVEDLTGNVVGLKHKITLSNDQDVPEAFITFPHAGSAVSNPILLAGYATDDDGILGFEYSIDGSEFTRVSSSSSFSVDLGDLEPGNRSISVRAVDVNGLTGPAALAKLMVLPAPPEILMDGITIDTGVETYVPGFVFAVDTAAKLTGRIPDGRFIQTVEYSLNGGAAKKATLKAGEAGERIFEIVLPKESAAGRLEVSVSAIDAFGQEGKFRTILYRGERIDQKGLYLTGGKIDGSIIALGTGDTLLGYAVGGPVQSVTIQPETDTLSLLNEGNIVILTGLSEGVSSSVTLIARLSDGSTLSAGPFTVYVDDGGPEISIESPASGDWVRGPIRLSGSASDPAGVKSVRYAVSGTAAGEEPPVYQSVPVTDGADGAAFDITVPIDSAADGNLTLLVEALDVAGNVSIVPLSISVDRIDPELRIVTPVQGEILQGIVTISGEAIDSGGIRSVGVSDDGMNYLEIGASRNFRYDADFSRYDVPPEAFHVKVTDLAGNETKVSATLSIDKDADKPEVQIHLPEEGSVIRGDFTVSGMVFDDDGVSAIYYRFDDGAWRRLDGSNSYSVFVPLSEMSDNDHRLEVRAEDLNGVESDIASVAFMVSRSEPESNLTAPILESTIRGLVTLEGTSSDANGIRRVAVSFDNGTTYNTADGTDEWTYLLDTRMLEDGLYSILVRATDNTGTDGLYSTLLNVDNTPPVIKLDYPRDGDAAVEGLIINGSAKDNIALTSLSYAVSPIDGNESKVIIGDLPVTGNFSDTVDLGALSAGWYDFMITAVDGAMNDTVLSRNFVIREKESTDSVDIIFPVEGASISGTFELSGRIRSAETVGSVAVYADDVLVGSAEVTEYGFFQMTVNPGKIRDGLRVITARADFPGGITLVSLSRRIEYSAAGPWVSIDNLSNGDFVNGRPFIEGRAGIAGSGEGSGDDVETVEKRTGNEKVVQSVEVSTDNGKTFEKAQGTDVWKYRLETQEFPDGELVLLVRADFVDGGSAASRILVRVDETPPDVSVLSPQEGVKFNDELFTAGIAYDDNGLESVGVTLRQGDKSRYQVPAFIQGLYLDIHALGATYADIGAGLTFFDDNVKLQAQIGIAPIDPPGRFSGLVIGAKLLANIAALPFGYFLGPDWDFFSMSFAVGANFSYFTMSDDTIAFTDEGLVLGAVVGQWEFAKFRFESLSVFNALGLYVEGQLWFISSDVLGGLEPRIVIGMRADIF